MLDPDRFDLLTFDCFGTLIDWETGLLAALRPLFPGVDDEALLALYARCEPAAEAGPFVPYRTVLRRTALGIAGALGRGEPDDPDALARSLALWPPFPDTVAALRRLSGRFGLAILSNVDDDLLATTRQALEVPFTAVVTAQSVGAYKPDPAFFQAALARLPVPATRILHCAQSLYHDVGIASTMGLATVHVDRRAGRAGGATPASSARANLTVGSLAALAEVLLP